MPEIEIEDSVSRKKFQIKEIPENVKKSFYTASGTSKSMLLTCNVSRIHALQVVSYWLLRQPMTMRIKFYTIDV